MLILEREAWGITKKKTALLKTTGSLLDSLKKYPVKTMPLPRAHSRHPENVPHSKKGRPHLLPPARAIVLSAAW